jgi:N-methylhydantoinase B/oxoprolinase/acetone carboxylase alpha subunit
MTNSRLTDPEILEWRFPVLLESFSIRNNSGGKGKYQGGGSAAKTGNNWVQRADGNLKN